jgi:signal transduction histidine kinase
MSFDANDMHAALMHELKNNLGQLTMALDDLPVLGLPEHDAKVDAARLICRRSGERLQQALLVYKAARGVLRPQVDAHSPIDFLRELDDAARSLGRGRLHIDTLIGDQVPEYWFFDRALVEMALMNALHNALAYARARIQLEADLTDGCLAFTVRDDSAGYPESILAQAGEPGVESVKGTGLGLHFARLIAELHDNQGRRGSLQLRNDAGAVFSLLLP